MRYRSVHSLIAPCPMPKRVDYDFADEIECDCRAWLRNRTVGTKVIRSVVVFFLAIPLLISY